MADFDLAAIGLLVGAASILDFLQQDADRRDLRGVSSCATGPVTPVATFQDLHDSERDQCLRLAWLLTHEQQLSEDIVQESFTAVWERFDQIVHHRAYLRTAIVNAVRKQARSSSREQRRHRLYAATVPVDNPPPQDPLTDLIAALPLKQRTVVVLRFWGDLTYEQIAVTMGLRASSVRSLAHRAMKSLRSQVEP